MNDPIARLTAALETRYEIGDEIGAGGMATVYLAKDLRHDRQVALKLLRPELGAVIGAERFLAEIRTTAKLQHPHILPLFDSGEADGLLFYVMPYVEGISLRDRIQREKQIAISDAVRIASEVASALDYAHRHGVIHRDIKPENILLHDGQALVADFGIALALSNAGSTRMTETGMSLGTPHYMSPEQAMGERDITARSDVYALGAITYEMLAGEPPFTGPTAQAIIARVVTESPRPLVPKRHTIPPHIEAAVLTALEKVPADRFATAAEFAQALRTPGFTGGRTAVTATTFPKRLASLSKKWQAVAAATAILLIAAAFGAGRYSADEAAPPITGRFLITTPAEHRLTSFGNLNLAISPDGSSLVYAGQDGRARQLYIRKMDEVISSPIPGTEEGTDPGFSPDGRWITFWRGARLQKVSVSGGAPIAVPITNTNINALSAVWLDGADVIATDNNGAIRRQGGDGKSSIIARPDTARHETLLLLTDVLPDRKTGLVVSVPGGASSGRGYVLDLKSGKRTLLIDQAIGGLNYDNGYVAWVQQDGTLLGAPFDGKKLTAPPVTIAQRVRFTVGGPPQFSVSKAGSLVYVPEQPFQLMYVDRNGKAEPVLDLKRRFHSPRVSPNGRYIAMDFTQQNSRDVWTLDLSDKTLSRLTFDNDGHDPVWNWEGTKVAYASARNGVIGMFMRNADGSGSTDSIHVGATAQTVGAFVRNSDEVVTINTSQLFGNNDLYTLFLNKRTTPTALLGSPFSEGYPAVSPDGKWLAFVSDESGQPEVYVRPLQGQGAKTLVSRSGGTEPVWSRNGRELFYFGFGGTGMPLVAAAVSTDGEFKVLGRTDLFEASEFEGATPHANYDVMPDGRFVMVHQGRMSEIIIVQNWTAEVKRRNAGSR
ncbi:MAG: serine/threonine-protein kinase [Gemmatimonadaceae bacterium]|nr:serine/threonine-protein kinase [Gemmatimonadaceae bacterium]